MKMKHIELMSAAIFALIIPEAAIAASAANVASEVRVGRYQLFSGSYGFIGLDGIERQSTALFKIDTATGEIFECSGSAYDGASVNKPGKVVSQKSCTPFEQRFIYDKP